jgi:hypothetical protein
MIFVVTYQQIGTQISLAAPTTGTIKKTSKAISYHLITSCWRSKDMVTRRLHGPEMTGLTRETGAEIYLPVAPSPRPPFTVILLVVSPKGIFFGKQSD